MSIVIIIVALITNVFIVVFSFRKKMKYAPYSIFAIFWSLVFLCYLYMMNEWYGLDEYYAFIILLGNTLFIICSFIVGNLPIAQTELVVKGEYSLHYRLVFVLTVLTLFWLSKDLVDKIIMLFNGKSFNDIALYYSEKEDDSTIVSIFFSILVGKPFTYCSLCLFAYELFKGRDRKILVIVSQLLIIVLQVVQSGKRSMLIYLLFIIGVEILRKNWLGDAVKLSKKQKIVLTTFCVLIIIAIVYITKRRDSDFLDTIGVYLSGGIPSFGIRADTLEQHFYGTGILHGLLVPIILFLHGIFKIPYPEWYLNLDALVESADYINIGPEAPINAFNTMYFVPYLDGGITFLIIEVCFLGVLYGIAYNKLMNHDSPRNILIYLLLMIGIGGSSNTLYFTQYPYVIAFFYIYLLTKRRSKDNFEIIIV